MWKLEIWPLSVVWIRLKLWHHIGLRYWKDLHTICLWTPGIPSKDRDSTGRGSRGPPIPSQTLEICGVCKRYMWNGQGRHAAEREICCLFNGSCFTAFMGQNLSCQKQKIITLEGVGRLTKGFKPVHPALQPGEHTAFVSQMLPNPPSLTNSVIENFPLTIR